MKRYLINLKRRPDRLNSFFERCPYPKETIEIVEAFDGKFPEMQLESEKELLKKFRPHVNMGARGCAISHLRIWKKMIDEKIPIAMIFEDDAMFSENFKSFMETLKIPENCNIVYFGGRFHPDFIVPHFAKTDINDKIYRHKIEHWNMLLHERTTHGYIIRVQLAEFLLHVFDINQQNEAIDYQMIHTFKGLNLPYYSTNPLVCWSPIIGDSDIR